MQAIYAFGLLILIAFLGARFITKRTTLSPVNYFFYSGFIYIFLGLSLGHSGWDILSSSILTGLTPLIDLGLGWVGFLFGFQLETKYLKRFPRKYISLSFLQFGFVFLTGGFGFFLVLKLLYPQEQVYLLYGMASAFGLLLSLNSPTLLNMASRVIPERGNYYYLARFLASVSGFWGIVGLVVLLSFWHFPFFESQVLWKGGAFLLLSTLFAAILGAIFHYLTKKRTSEEQMLVYLLGLVFFVSGIAFYFNLPPLYMSMVLGITFSNLTKIHEKLYPLLLSTEKPLYIIFLVLIGALWEVSVDHRVVILVLLMVVLRLVTYILPLPLFKVALDFPLRLPGRFGLCFLSSGGIGVALAVSIKLAYPLVLTDTFLTIALVGVLITEFISPWGLRLSIFRLDSKEIK
jgi:Kef-type K+ transport system membrane component KefB